MNTELRVLEEIASRGVTTRNEINKVLSENSRNKGYYHLRGKPNSLEDRELVKEVLGCKNKSGSKCQSTVMVALTEQGKRCLENPNKKTCRVKS